MNESDVVSLINEIESVDFREFWWGSPLLARASEVRDSRVAQALVYRHHGLSNKEAFSAHVIRQAIKKCDGPDFNSLWRIIDAETDARALVERIEDLHYLPWAATFILGEVGGAHVFAGTTARLIPTHQVRFHLLVRLLSHIVIRYLQIVEDEEPTATVMDVESGQSKTVPLKEVGGDSYEMHLAKQSEANEYFTALDARIVTDAKSKLQDIPDSLLNIPKPQFIQALDIIQVRFA